MGVLIINSLCGKAQTPQDPFSCQLWVLAVGPVCWGRAYLVKSIRRQKALMAFILLGVLGVVWPPGLACPHPFSFICWLWSCRCRACSYTWSASTVPSSGYLLVLVPLLLSHGPQLSNLGLQSASNSFFQLWCPCMGVLGLGSAVTLLETTLQSLL